MSRIWLFSPTLQLPPAPLYYSSLPALPSTHSAGAQSVFKKATLWYFSSATSDHFILLKIIQCLPSSLRGKTRSSHHPYNRTLWFAAQSFPSVCLAFIQVAQPWWGHLHPSHIKLEGFHFCFISPFLALISSLTFIMNIVYVAFLDLVSSCSFSLKCRCPKAVLSVWITNIFPS